MTKELDKYDEILTREVKPFGTGAHIPVPSKHLGKRVKILVLKEEKNVE